MADIINPYIDLGIWQIIGLDSNGPAEQEYGGYLPKSELEYLQNNLHNSKKFSLIVMHHPAQVMGHGWLQSVKLENANELLSLLTDYPHVKAISFGHVHYAYDIKEKGISYLSNPSTYRQFAGEAKEFALAKVSRPGYRRLCLMNNGELITEPCFIS
jgi:Icc protein